MMTRVAAAAAAICLYCAFTPDSRRFERQVVDGASFENAIDLPDDYAAVDPARAAVRRHRPPRRAGPANAARESDEERPEITAYCPGATQKPGCAGGIALRYS